MAAYKLTYQPNAEEDINATLDFYEERGNIRAASYFRAHLVTIEKKLSAHPELYGYMQNEPFLRFIKLGKLNFIVIFDIADDTVFIYSVRHTSRDSFI